MTHFFPLHLDDLTLGKVRDGVEMAQLLAFRHRIFREELRWLSESADGLDRDEYDDFSDNLALTRGDEVIGSVRFTLGDQRYMIEKEFSRLLAPGEHIRKGRDCAEITRFAVDGSRGGRLAAQASRLLYLSLWQWACWNDIRWMYFVVKPAMYRRLVSIGFPVLPVGVPRPLDGGVMSMAGCFDWSLATPEFIRSLQRGASVPDASPVRSRAFDYSH